MTQTSISELRNTMLAGAESPLSPFLGKGYTPSFDPDAYHVMQERDNALIRDEILHGYASRAFVYEFDIKGTKVRGVSVIGARELATQYKGIKHRIVATVEKRGSLFVFRSFDPISITTQVLPELADEDDYYECIVEISDIKTGNSIQCRKKETRFERRRDGGLFARPHYDVIAESKAFRNGVLAVLPQSVIKDFEKRCLDAGSAAQEKTIGQMRDAVIQFAASKAIALDRAAVNSLSFTEINGLGAAARESLDAFRAALSAMGMLSEPAGAANAGPPPHGMPREGTEQTRLLEIAEAQAEQQQDEPPRRQRQARSGETE